MHERKMLNRERELRELGNEKEKPCLTTGLYQKKLPPINKKGKYNIKNVIQYYQSTSRLNQP
jgi:hypothetical protein